MQKHSHNQIYIEIYRDNLSTLDLHSDGEGILLDTSYFVEMLCTNMRYNAQNSVGMYAEIQILFKF